MSTKNIPHPSPIRFSIIIPVLHEGERINPLIEHLRALDSPSPFEIIVVDGSPTRDTIESIANKNVHCLDSEKGRAKQMNAGAGVAQGDVLVFLHADTQLPSQAFFVIERSLQDPEIVGGAFSAWFDSDKWIFKTIAITGTIRSRASHIPYGDQVIFLRKAYFQKLGGYPDIPIFEEIALMQMIRKVKGKIIILPEQVCTSSRRFEEEGILYALLRDAMLVILYYRGVPPVRLKRWYH
jgi:rSAM/selenodomain-associated transferase 2